MQVLDQSGDFRELRHQIPDRPARQRRIGFTRGWEQPAARAIADPRRQRVRQYIWDRHVAVALALAEPDEHDPAGEVNVLDAQAGDLTYPEPGPQAAQQ